MDGDCDGNQVNQSDGGQELKIRLNNPHFEYFTTGSFIGPDHERIVEHGDYPDLDDEHPQPTLVNSFLFYEEFNPPPPSYTPCLEIEELDFYLDKAHKIIYTADNELLPGSTTLYGQRPQGLHYEWFSIWTPSGTLQNDDLYWEHRYYIHYRQRVNIPPAYLNKKI
jgi:hypothetical protein